ncbi:MAG: DUF3530 family protein [Pseudomonadota bacterium]
MSVALIMPHDRCWAEKTKTHKDVVYEKYRHLYNDGSELSFIEIQNKEFATVTLFSKLKETKGLVILTQDIDEDFDSATLIKPLRQQLSARGWATVTINLHYFFSIQPDLALESKNQLIAEQATSIQNDDSESTPNRQEQESTSASSQPPEDTAQLDAESSAAAEEPIPKKENFNEATKLLGELFNQVITSFQLSNEQRVFIISHGISAYWSLEIINTIEINAFGFIALGIYYPEIKTNQSIATALSKVQTYVLDIYSDNDNRWVISQAESRRLMNQFREKNFRQVKMNHTDFHYKDHIDFLASKINGWMHFTTGPSKESR